MRRIYYYIIAFFSLACYGSIFISPEHFWLVGFFSLLIPVFMFYHLIMVAIRVHRLNRTFLFHLVMLVLAFPFFMPTFSFHLSSGQEADFSILSYNVRIFNAYQHLNDRHPEQTKPMVDWVTSFDADIKCIQEYYEHKDDPYFDISTVMRHKGWGYQSIKEIAQNNSGAIFGMAIFSRLPIINHGEVVGHDGQFQNAQFVDVVVHNDTIRLFNVHLQSMAIDEENIFDAEKLKDSYIDTGSRLRDGFKARARQLNFIIKDIKRSPYKVLLCGDLNEIPYSNVYHQLSENLKNAFEYAGKGFGFSYNGRLFFLRIDNQFFDQNINAINFSTHRDIKFSDHFPTSCQYLLDKAP